MIVAFMGHRPTKSGSYSGLPPTNESIAQKIEYYLFNMIANKIICGASTELDHMVIDIVYKYKRRLNLELEVVIPYASPHYDLDELEYKADIITNLHDDPRYLGHSLTDALKKYNEYLIDHSDQLFVVWDGSYGGTKYCVDRAYATDKKIYILNPVNLILSIVERDSSLDNYM